MLTWFCIYFVRKHSFCK